MAEQEKDYYNYTVSVNGTTLESIAQIIYENAYVAQGLLDYKDNFNNIAIYNNYTDDQKKQYAEAQVDVAIPLGTTLILPQKERKLILNFQENKNLKIIGINEINEAFWSNEVKTYLDKMLVIENKKNNGEYFLKRNNTIYIKIWSRVLNQVLYVSLHVNNFSMNVNQEGGAFGFSLPPIEGKLNQLGIWQKLNYTEFNDNEESFSKTSIVSDVPNVNTSKIYYYEKVLNPQDLVFIKLDKQFQNKDTLDITDDYDMIGLIDQVKTSISQNDNNINCEIKITGRDLMKIFIEDGTYFYPYEFYEASIDTADIPNKKRILSQSYDSGLAKGAPLSYLFPLLVNIMHNIKYQIPSVTSQNGIWDYIDLQFEKEAGERVLYDTSLATQQGSVINFIKSILIYPFTELICDTFGSVYTLIIRTSPISKKAYLNNRTLDIGIRHLVSDETYFDDSNVRSWFHLKPEALYLGYTAIIDITFPGVYISELANIFGARKIEFSHQYSYYSTDNTDNQKPRKDAMILSLEDLKFIVEGFACEPFTSVTVTPDTPISDNASLTSSSLKGFTTAVINFIFNTSLLEFIKSRLVLSRMYAITQIIVI